MIPAVPPQLGRAPLCWDWSAMSRRAPALPALPAPGGVMRRLMVTGDIRRPSARLRGGFGRGSRAGFGGATAPACTLPARCGCLRPRTLPDLRSIAHQCSPRGRLASRQAGGWFRLPHDGLARTTPSTRHSDGRPSPLLALRCVAQLAMLYCGQAGAALGPRAGERGEATAWRRATGWRSSAAV